MDCWGAGSEMQGNTAIGSMGFMGKAWRGILGVVVAGLAGAGLLSALAFVAIRYGDKALVNTVLFIVVAGVGVMAAVIWRVINRFRQAKQIRLRIERTECPG